MGPFSHTPHSAEGPQEERNSSHTTVRNRRPSARSPFGHNNPELLRPQHRDRDTLKNVRNSSLYCGFRTGWVVNVQSRQEEPDGMLSMDQAGGRFIRSCYYY